MIGVNVMLVERAIGARAFAPPPDRFTTAQYWRIFMPVPNPETPADNLALGRVWMYRNGVKLSFDGAWFYQSSRYNGRGADRTFQTSDMPDPTSAVAGWTSAIANPVNEWIECDFREARAVDSIVFVPIMYRNGARNPQTFAIQCSDDAQLWTTLVAASGLDWTDGAQKAFAINGTTRRIAPMARWPGTQVESFEAFGPDEPT